MITAKVTDFGLSLILSTDGIKEPKNDREVQGPIPPPSYSSFYSFIHLIYYITKFYFFNFIF